MHSGTVPCLLLLTAVPHLMAADPPIPAKGSRINLAAYVQTFGDDFNGSTLDPAKWEAPAMPRQGGSRWNPALVSLQDGHLRLDVRLTSDPTLRYDCGAVRTQRNYDINQTMFSQGYGYYEASIQMPRHLDCDYFADFWIMAGRIGDGQTDTRLGTEIDIVESFNLAPGLQHSATFHWGGYGKTHNVGSIKLGDQPTLRDGNFHTYGLLWTQSYYAFYLDGVNVGATNMLNLGKSGDGKVPSQGTCQAKGYLKLSVEAAAWCGRTNGWEKDLPKEDVMLVDFIRAYQPK